MKTYEHYTDKLALHISAKSTTAKQREDNTNES